MDYSKVTKQSLELFGIVYKHLNGKKAPYQLVENTMNMFRLVTGYQYHQFKIHEYIQFLFETNNETLLMAYREKFPEIQNIYYVAIHQKMTLNVLFESKISYEDWVMLFYDKYQSDFTKHLKDLPSFIIDNTSSYDFLLKVN